MATPVGEVRPLAGLSTVPAVALDKDDTQYIENTLNVSDPVFEGLTEQEMTHLEKRLVRKIDIHLIFTLFFLFIFNILDRTNIASARLGGLQTDLHLTDTQYQTVVAIMSVGYLIGQIPSNIFMTRVHPSRYLPICIFVWGSVSICTAATQNFAGMFVIRFLIGLTESPFFAGSLLMISSWYKPSEIAPRVAFMYCGNTIANGFGGLLAAGVLSGLADARGIRGWRWLYLIEGSGTIIVGFFAFFMLPDFPMSGRKRWLTEQEQRYAAWRIAGTVNGEADDNGKIKDGLKNSVTDIKVWMLVGVQLCLLTSQTWTYFFPSIVDTLGYSETITLLLTAPVYVFGFLASMANSLVAAHTGHRAVLVMWPLALDIVGNVMVIASHNTAVRYIGMFLMCAGSYSAFNVVQAWVGSTVPRTRTKRAVSYALVNMIASISNIYGGYFFPSNNAPQYIPGGIALSSFAFGGVCLAAALGLYLRRLNSEATKLEQQDGMIRYKFLV